MSSTIESSTLPEALSELNRNFSLRRMLLVTLNVIVPACVLSGMRTISLTEVPSEFSSIVSYSVPAIGLIISLASALVAYAILRCQFGIVVNSASIQWKIYGKPLDPDVNFGGITVGFYILSIISIALGFLITFFWSSFTFITAWPQHYVFAFASTIVALTFSVAVIKLIDLHNLAIKVSNKNIKLKEKRTEYNLKDTHRISSLDATNDDIALIVVQAVILFSGTLLIIPTIISIPDDGSFVKGLASPIRHYGVAIMTLYTAIVLWLSQRLVFRLRVAIAEHSTQLHDNKYSEQTASTWEDKLGERTSILYIFLSTLCAIVMMLHLLLVWTDSYLVFIFGVTFIIGSRLGYSFKLGLERKKYIEYWKE